MNSYTVNKVGRVVVQTVLAIVAFAAIFLPLLTMISAIHNIINYQPFMDPSYRHYVKYQILDWAVVAMFCGPYLAWCSGYCFRTSRKREVVMLLTLFLLQLFLMIGSGIREWYDV